MSHIRQQIPSAYHPAIRSTYHMYIWCYFVCVMSTCRRLKVVHVAAFHNICFKHNIARNICVEFYYVPTGPGAHLTSCTMGYRVFIGGKVAEAWR
jgi:hypothetical protein